MNCENLVGGYLDYLKKDLLEVKENGICKLELPFPRPAGDSIVLTIKTEKKDLVLISDDGFMDDYLFSYGIDLWDLSADRMKELFSRLVKRYNIIKNRTPEIAITVKKEDLFHGIFEMSNIMNELSSLKLLVTPSSFDPFRNQVEMYFKEHKIKFDPDRSVKIELHNNPYNFKFEFAFKKFNAYTKIITSNDIVKDWAVNFDQIKKRFITKNRSVELWALYNDKDTVDRKRINDFLDDYADQILAWSKDKELFNKFKSD